MEQTKKPVKKLNNSKPITSPKLLKALEKIKDGGTIAYVFLTDRVKFSKEFPEGEVYQKKSILYSNVNSEIFFKMVDGRRIRRSPQEVLQIFDDTKWDNGASYYIIG